MEDKDVIMKGKSEGRRSGHQRKGLKVPKLSSVTISDKLGRRQEIKNIASNDSSK